MNKRSKRMVFLICMVFIFFGLSAMSFYKHPLQHPRDKLSSPAQINDPYCVGDITWTISDWTKPTV